MEPRNTGVTADPLFVVVTRPPMRFGATYAALLLILPVHGNCMLLCARDARYFDLLLMWARMLVSNSPNCRFCTLDTM